VERKQQSIKTRSYMAHKARIRGFIPVEILKCVRILKQGSAEGVI
jgi:hypothetical protein